MIFKRSLVSELTNTAGGVFTVLFTIVMAVGVVRILSLAAGGRIDNAAVLQMVLYNILQNLSPLLTASLFIAILVTLMRAWQDNEMVVWFSSGGQSLLAWIGPTLRFTIPIVLCVGLLSIVVGPWARAQSDVIRTQFQQRDDVNAIAPGRFIETKGGKLVFFIEQAGEDNSEVSKIFMAETSPDKEAVVTASSGSVEVNAEGDRYVVLHDGQRYETQKDSAASRIVSFDAYSVRLDIKLDQPLRASKSDQLPITMLLAAPTPENQAQLLWRLAWPLAAFNLALLAIPLSCTSPRAGRSLNLIVAALIFVLYLNAISICETWVEQGKIGLWPAYFALNGFVLLIVTLLFYRRVYRMRWLPPWCSIWYLRTHGLPAFKKKGAMK